MGRKSISYCCSLKEILERQLITYRRWAVATFSAVAKAFAGGMRSSHGPMLCRCKVDYADTIIGQLTEVRIPCRLKKKFSNELLEAATANISLALSTHSEVRNKP